MNHLLQKSLVRTLEPKLPVHNLSVIDDSEDITILIRSVRIESKNRSPGLVTDRIRWTSQKSCYWFAVFRSRNQGSRGAGSCRGHLALRYLHCTIQGSAVFNVATGNFGVPLGFLVSLTKNDSEGGSRTSLLALERKTAVRASCKSW